jgi:AcrR family transcriptional regulator
VASTPASGRSRGGPPRDGAGVPRGRRPKQAEPGDTREAILNAAESHFAHHGFYGVTVRQVARSAGVDPALLHYYFDSKRGLFDAAFLRRAQILNEKRVASLAAYEEAAEAAATLEGCLHAFFRPMMEYWSEGEAGWRDYFRLVALVNNTPDWGGETMGRYFDPAIQRLIAAFKRVAPAAREEDLYWCWSFISGGLTLAFAQTGRIERLSGGLCHSDDLAAIEARLAPFMAAGVREICRRGAAAQG